MLFWSVWVASPAIADKFVSDARSMSGVMTVKSYIRSE
jgi:hypothetical protein